MPIGRGAEGGARSPRNEISRFVSLREGERGISTAISSAAPSLLPLLLPPAASREGEFYGS